jgi:uncharacterized protein YxeA
MKKILFVVVILSTLLFAALPGFTVIKDITGKKHIYYKLEYNKENYCEIHEKHELVELRKRHEKHNIGTYPRRKQKTKDLRVI